MADDREHSHILEFWQNSVDTILSEIETTDFLARPEVAKLARMPARQRKWGAGVAMRENPKGKLLLREWLACAREYRDPHRGPDTYYEGISGHPPSPHWYEPDYWQAYRGQ